jgi:hypothetical protein
MTSQQRKPDSHWGAALAGLAPRILLVTLLIILAMAGLRGAVATPKWTGSHAADVASGVVLFVILAVLLGIMLRRRRVAAQLEGGEVLYTAAKLRAALIAALALGMAADVVAVLIALHLKLPKIKDRRNVLAQQSAAGQPTQKTQHLAPTHTGAFPIGDFLWGLLTVVLIVIIVLTARWLARQERVPHLPEDELIAEDSADLREAVESGRAALRTFDDAKAAIIACYVAMEQSLAERGAARAVADTPDELLARATQNQIVRGTAAARLTALFYEARFSSHPMDQAQRHAAEQALNELARALADKPRPEQQAEQAQQQAEQAEQQETGA